jgi:hypothetical protein
MIDLKINWSGPWSGCWCFAQPEDPSFAVYDPEEFFARSQRTFWLHVRSHSIQVWLDRFKEQTRSEIHESRRQEELHDRATEAAQRWRSYRPIGTLR